MRLRSFAISHSEREINNNYNKIHGVKLYCYHASSSYYYCVAFDMEIFY